MVRLTRLSKPLFVVGVITLIILNLYTFVVAYPETYMLTPGINTSGSILAKDFSAYYVGVWRLWNSPSNVYTVGSLSNGEPAVLPQPETYKYLPSFLLIISPLLALDYQQALLAFDIIQFALLPIMAFMIFHLLKKKALALTFLVLTIALLLPFPTPNWGFSPSYYWQWGEGQAKVFSTFLILLCFYLGSRGRPYLSGAALALGFFDPRWGLLAIPLFIMYNRKNLKAAAISVVSVLVLSNITLLFYPGMTSQFLMMIFNSGISTPLYYYAFIPFFTIVSLICVNFKELIAAFDYRHLFSFTEDPEPRK